MRDVDGSVIEVVNIVATFVFGLSGGLAAVRVHLDVFGVLVLAAVVAIAGGTVRDLLIGVPPETFRDWRYLAAAGAAGLVCIVGHRLLERLQRAVVFFDAVGLSSFCVTGASKAIEFDLGPVQAVILGAISGIGGGMLRDVLLREVPIVLRSELYAVPALLGASVVVVAHQWGNDDPALVLVGAAVCLAVRLVGVRYGVTLPVASAIRPRGRSRDID